MGAVLPLAARISLLTPLSFLAMLGGPTPSAVAAEPLGAISGVVTDASTHAPLAGIEACAFSINSELLGEEEFEHAFGCAKTNAAGEYTVSELQPESYAVVFSAAGKLDYITQYYEAKLPPAEPTPVAVAAGKTTPGVDAQLVLGAEISGRVTDAATAAPLEGVLVGALKADTEGSFELVSFALSGANGEYVVMALPSGSYKVGFASQKYLLQYYDDKSTQAEAASVSVLAPEVTSGVDAALQAGVAPVSPIVPPASLPGAGSTMPAGTKPVTAPKHSAGGTLSLSDSHIAVESDGVTLVKVACSAAARCRAKITLKMEQTVTVKGKRTRRSVAIGTSRVLSIAAGRKVTVTIQLNASGRHMLSAAHGRLDVELALVTPGHTHDESVELNTLKARG